jgi:signal transduction histidine kinase
MSITERLFNRMMVGVVLFGFLALMAAGGTAGFTVARSKQFTGWVNHSNDVQARLSDFRLALERTETARRGSLLDDNSRYDDIYRTFSVSLPLLLDRVAILTADNPNQQRRTTQARVLLGAMLTSMDESIALIRAGRRQEAQAAFRMAKTSDMVKDMRTITEAMAAEEAGLLKARSDAQRSAARNLYVVLAVSAVLLGIVAVSSLWVILNYTRDLTASRNALRVMNLGLESAVAERTADFKRANEEIQRFAYIVSHDLRSPLVNVMGFTSELDAATRPLEQMLEKVEAEAPQLVTPEAREAIRTDLPEAVGFIRTATQKMDRLINAILRLSREGRRVIAPEKLNMQSVLQGVADGIRHQASERGAIVEIDGDVPDIVSDRLAIEQIFSNLVENAVKYLAKGRPGLIQLRGRAQGDHVIFEVRDNGRGIDPKDHDRVFDLFRRSGSQDQPGEGIGLAHVRALAYRLGGLITCESALDQGATFRLSLPKILNLDRGAPTP